jgi:serine protease Do
VLRWGRVLRSESSAILTDCTLVGGDSGGPLFDLDGNVIGIHSRIGKNLTVNVHVPVEPFLQSWDRLVRGEVWGLLADQEAASPAADSSGKGPASDFAWLGVIEDRQSSDRVRISDVIPDSPAARAGLEPGDVIEQIDQKTIDSFGTLQREIREHAPGDRVRLQVRRGDIELKLHVRLAGRVRIPRP